MKWSVLALITLITFFSGTLAGAHLPDEGESSPLPVSPTPEAALSGVPDGIYYVTETYVADFVSTSGPTTIYSTATVHQSTGTYARMIDTVDTGAASVFDGEAFNGRGALTDGRAIAGTYYENFVLTADGFVPVSIVFFQDDSETSRDRSSGPVVVEPVATRSALPSRATVDVPSVPANTPAPSQRPVAQPARPADAPPPAARNLRAGVALAPDGPTLASAELLRGRAVQFWLRAFLNDVAVPVRSWRLVSAPPDYAAPMSGSDQPFVAQWLRMPSPGAPWLLRFEILTDVGSERLDAQISVMIRSPALVD